MKLDLLKPLRLLAALTALLPFAAGNAAETSADGLTLGPADSRNVLVVHASNSVQVFRGVLEDFSRLNPGLRLEYTELSTQELYAGTVSRATQAPATRSGPDIVISSAMDLQTKLVNDGYAQPHISPETRALPAWANWRDEVFSIGTDPIVMVYNTSKLASARAPRTRRELLSLLQAPDPSPLTTSRAAASATWRPRRTRGWTAWLARCWPNWAATAWPCTRPPKTRWTSSNAARSRWPTTCWSPTPGTASTWARRWPSSIRRTTR
jgi:hypothetical protein